MRWLTGQARDFWLAFRVSCRESYRLAASGAPRDQAREAGREAGMQAVRTVHSASQSVRDAQSDILGRSQ